MVLPVGRLLQTIAQDLLSDITQPIFATEAFGYLLLGCLISWCDTAHLLDRVKYRLPRTDIGIDWLFAIELLVLPDFVLDQFALVVESLDKAIVDSLLKTFRAVLTHRVSQDVVQGDDQVIE